MSFLSGEEINPSTEARTKQTIRPCRAGQLQRRADQKGRRILFIHIKPDAKPICDLHHTSMQVTTFEMNDMKFDAHCCLLPECHRVYQHGQGYHDAEVGQRVSFHNRNRKECPECQATMYLAAVSDTEERWECGQFHCDHGESVALTQRQA